VPHSAKDPFAECNGAGTWQRSKVCQVPWPWLSAKNQGLSSDSDWVLGKDFFQKKEKNKENYAEGDARQKKIQKKGKVLCQAPL